MQQPATEAASQGAAAAARAHALHTSQQVARLTRHTAGSKHAETVKCGPKKKIKKQKQKEKTCLMGEEGTDHKGELLDYAVVGGSSGSGVGADEQGIPHVKGMHHKQHDHRVEQIHDAVAEGKGKCHNDGGHGQPHLCQVHLHSHSCQCCFSSLVPCCLKIPDAWHDATHTAVCMPPS